MTTWFDNGFHFMAVGVCVYAAFVLLLGKCIHLGMGPDGQEGGAK